MLILSPAELSGGRPVCRSALEHSKVYKRLISLQADRRAAGQRRPQCSEAQSCSELAQERGRTWPLPGADPKQTRHPSEPDSACGGGVTPF